MRVFQSSPPTLLPSFFPRVRFLVLEPISEPFVCLPSHGAVATWYREGDLSKDIQGGGSVKDVRHSKAYYKFHMDHNRFQLNLDHSFFSVALPDL